MNTVAKCIKTHNVHGNVANCPGQGRKRKWKPRLIRWINLEGGKRARKAIQEPLKLNSEVSTLYLPTTIQPDWTLPRSILTRPKASGRFSFGLMKKKLSGQSHYVYRRDNISLKEKNTQTAVNCKVLFLWGTSLLYLAQRTLNVSRFPADQSLDFQGIQEFTDTSKCQRALVQVMGPAVA